MPFRVLLRLSFKPETLEEVPNILHTTVAATRSFPGIASVDILHSHDEPANFIIESTWNSEADYDKYAVFRASEEGTPVALLAALDGDYISEFWDVRDDN